MTVDEKAKELAITKGTDSTYGARPLRRAIQNLIEDKIAEEIIEENVKKGDKITITEQDGKITVEK